LAEHVKTPVDRNELVSFANNYLEFDRLRDYGPQGLQFTGTSQVSKIACGVSVSLDLIDSAIEWGADALVVHHGLFWNNEPRYIDKRMLKRLDHLAAGDLNLMAYHLSLDAHSEVGNNILTVRNLGVRKPHRFADVGWGGKLFRPLKVKEVSEEWDGIKYLYGPTVIRKVASIVGGAAHYIHEAHAEGYDMFITGEAAEPTQALAKELGINFVAQGHYNTEKVGVQALTDYLGLHFNLETTFLDIPNSV
jgi:dinuclear metal center YbgI/SA1388 family protein